MKAPRVKERRSRKDVYWLGGFALLALVGLAVAATQYTKSRPTKTTTAPPTEPASEATVPQQPASAATTSPSILVRPDSHSLGPQNALVTVVEFLDPECESCREIYPVVKQLLHEYKGRMRLVVRIMPFHQNSPRAASALEAAAQQGRYWEMLETLFVNQPSWGSHHDPKPELIPELARKLGLDMDAFNRSIDDPAHRQRLEIDRGDGRALGVTGTPTFFVNGRPVDRLGYEPLKQAIDQALAR